MVIYKISKKLKSKQRKHHKSSNPTLNRKLQKQKTYAKLSGDLSEDIIAFIKPSLQICPTLSSRYIRSTPLPPIPIPLPPPELPLTLADCPTTVSFDVRRREDWCEKPLRHGQVSDVRRRDFTPFVPQDEFSG